MSAIKSREKGRVHCRSDGRVRGLGIARKRGDAQTVRRQGFAPEAIVPDKLRSDDALDSETHALVGKFRIGQIFFYLISQKRDEAFPAPSDSSHPRFFETPESITWSMRISISQKLRAFLVACDPSKNVVPR
jgi:hypothetical protein